MSREPLNVALAIAAVLLLATGGAWLVSTPASRAPFALRHPRWSPRVPGS